MWAGGCQTTPADGCGLMKERERVIERRASQCAYYTFESLDAVPGLSHAVFTRYGGHSQPPYGALNLAISTGEDPARVERNRQVVQAVLGLPLISARAVHGTDAIHITRELIVALGDALPAQAELGWSGGLRDALRFQPADALVTDQPGFALFWAFGDCAPVLLYDPAHHVIALIHAGWRGAARGILPGVIAGMGERYGTRPAELRAALGPAIGACCYEVSEEVRATFAAHPLAGRAACFEERAPRAGQPHHLYLDIARSNEGQLLAAGVPREGIERSGYCTGCRTDLFYSHRREPTPSGRFGVGIGLLEA
jgi:YfiH family protein